MKYTTIGAINRYRSESINPALHPDMVFEVYSVPVYETGHPEFLHGKEIGSTKQIVQKDDVLICKINPRINRVWVVADESDKQNIASSEWIVVRNQEYNPEFLGWYFRSSKFKTLMVSEVTGIGGSLTRAQPKRVASYPVPLLHRSEQDAIVRVLNTCATTIEAYQRQLRILDSLIKARFVEMFGDPEINPMGWRVEKLGNLLSFEPQNGLYKPQSDYVQNGTGTPILRIDAFYEGKVTSFSGLKRLVCTDMERMRYLLHENDIVINRVNSIEYLGKCAWITGMIEPTVFESNMMRFHVDESQIDPCYLTRLLCSTYIYNQILNRAKKAVNQASINQGDVQSFLIVVPPIGLQKSFADFVSQVDKSKATIQSALQKTQTLFDSLMQQYFG